MKTFSLVSKVFLIAGMFALLLPSTTSAQLSLDADYGLYSDGWGSFRGYSYFENAYLAGGGNYDWIPKNAHGSFSINGSVMPSWKSGSTTSGGGAIGTKALGVAPSEENSQVLKQALFDYLQDSNTYQLHAAGTP